MSRNTEPHLLSIQAIIQKSQINKFCNDIPPDLKRLFIDQFASKDFSEANQTKYPQLQKTTSHFINKKTMHSLPIQVIQSKGDKNMVPPLPPKQKRSISLNSSKKLVNQQHTTHKAQSSRSINKRKMSKQLNSRYSLCEVMCNKLKIDTQKRINVIPQHSPPHLSPKKLETPNQRTQSHKIEKKLSRFQFSIPLSENKASKVRQSLSNKLLQGHIVSVSDKSKEYPRSNNTSTNSNNLLDKKRKKITIMTEQQQEIHFEEVKEQDDYQEQQMLQQNENNQMKQNQKIHQPKQKKIQQKQQKIPVFLLNALETQTKQAQKKSINNFKNIQIKLGQGKDHTVQHSNNRIMKQPNSIVKMKRRMSSQKSKKTEQSELEPQAQLIKLLGKKRGQQMYGTIKNPKTYTANEEEDLAKAIKRKSSSKKQPRKKKFHVEENVCGWEVQDTPMFFDNY